MCRSCRTLSCRRRREHRSSYREVETKLKRIKSGNVTSNIERNVISRRRYGIYGSFGHLVRTGATRIECGSNQGNDLFRICRRIRSASEIPGSESL